MKLRWSVMFVLVAFPGCYSFSSPPAVVDGGAGAIAGTGGTGSGGTGTGGATGGGTGGSNGTGGSAGTIGTGGSTGGMSDGGPADACVGDACDCPDTDGDGFNDCVDGCPNDVFKHDGPGMCGCGVSDIDNDADGIADCLDVCPFDNTKTTSAGVCGCGKSDTLDTDGDGRVDCLDGCPKDPSRTTAGPCGCVPDATPLCLVHRYGFDGTGTTVADAITIAGISPANGTAMNATLAGAGSITLAGGTTDQYVSLPAGIISSLGNSATLETWVTWTVAAGAWQRIFDFGSSDAVGGVGQGTGATYLFVSPLNGNTNTLRAAFTVGSIGGERQVTGPAALPSAVQTHIAVVVDGTTNVMTLYENGVSVGQVALTGTTLTALNDVNNWLGRSQFTPDPEFAGSITEFRIYSAARTGPQVMNSFTLGPDVLPTQ
jgi:hypothetical protein